MNEFNNETENVLQEQICEDLPAEAVLKRPGIKLSGKQIVSLICIACCIGVFVIGVLTAVGTFYTPSEALDTSGMAGTVYTSHKAYGGDAYTGIQQAAADASNNAASAAYNVGVAVDHLKNITRAMDNHGRTTHRAVGIAVACMGVLGACYFGTKCTDSVGDKQ